MPLFKRHNEQSGISSASTIPSVATRDQLELASSILSNVSTQSSFSDIIKTVSAANAATISEQPCRPNKSNFSPKIISYKCICCGTELQIPLGFLYFKCSICETFHDKRVKSTFTKSVQQLTLRIVEKAIEKDKQQHEGIVGDNKEVIQSYPNLEALLINAFSCVDVLNKSFPIGLAKLSYSRPNIDFEDVLSFSESNDVISALSLEILERSVSILSHAPKRVRHYLLNWISRYPTTQFQSKVELLNAYITHKLTEVSSSKTSTKSNRAFSLLDNIYSPILPKLDIAPGSPSSINETHHNAVILESEESNPFSSPSSLSHEAVFEPELSSSKRKRLSSTVKVNSYGKNWKISSFAILQAIYFNANIITHKIPISSFYNTMVDYIDIRADFDAWEKLGVPMSMPSMQSLVPSSIKSSAIESQISWEKILFAFCEYPFFLSMGTKINILEYDARRQMAHKAHEAFFNSLDTHIPQQLYLHICVRRDHLLQDSFQILEAQENDLKKGIRVKFVDEPGIDVGGLKKEWFLLLIRELFSEELGLFKVEDSGYSWFKPGSDKPLKYFKLTGVVLGLALYNSTILETNFPLVVFKKLLGASFTLDDFKTLIPSYGKSLQMLLDYTGDDFEDVFYLFFDITRESNDTSVVTEELVPNGSSIPVTKKNRHDYVKRVVTFYLESSIKRQFEPLKQGFYKVAASNSLALFQPEEIQLLINGSDEPIDVDALRAVTQYKHWLPRYSNPDQDVQVIKWFWKYFKSLEPSMQRNLLMFVTGSDRIPATGIVTMSFTITRHGGDSNRYPISHTCFNELCLYEYSSKQKLVNMLSRAINESQGFGLK
ncbi:uncharacterized protein SAPINGB_P004805 [Magnusiomyces paraingens]|uniref:HECT-type E3 ubiquitin transferase n=1 Tax=Magnusiomyces paraingens TaxID=2606893 RepID=A0A5E8BXB3_9ASCO|nr:uncharacterized protein SAPINGB_P004805 [Saprochaete ingens]VVT56094.1 unnamed protein product [Saprochaete ingens]